MIDKAIASNEVEHESLGSYLYSQRTKRQLEIEDIENDTKIPARLLRAMESDDFTTLPAEAFARGFYVLYAKSLELDVELILQLYTKARGLPSKNMYAELPSKNEKPVNTLASRPMISPGSLLGFTLVLVIIIFTGICYYLSWNPATYFSDFLRSFQNKTSLEKKEEAGSQSTEKNNQEKEAVSTTPKHMEVDGAPLVVMSGNKVSYYTRNGVVFLTVPPAETIKN